MSYTILSTQDRYGVRDGVPLMEQTVWITPVEADDPRNTTVDGQPAFKLVVKNGFTDFAACYNQKTGQFSAAWYGNPDLAPLDPAVTIIDKDQYVKLSAALEEKLDAARKTALDTAINGGPKPTSTAKK